MHYTIPIWISQLCTIFPVTIHQRIASWNYAEQASGLVVWGHNPVGTRVLRSTPRTTVSIIYGRICLGFRVSVCTVLAMADIVVELCQLLWLWLCLLTVKRSVNAIQIKQTNCTCNKPIDRHWTLWWRLHRKNLLFRAPTSLVVVVAPWMSLLVLRDHWPTCSGIKVTWWDHASDLIASLVQSWPANGSSSSVFCGSCNGWWATRRVQWPTRTPLVTSGCTNLLCSSPLGTDCSWTTTVAIKLVGSRATTNSSRRTISNGPIATTSLFHQTPCSSINVNWSWTYASVTRSVFSILHRVWASKWWTVAIGSTVASSTGNPNGSTLIEYPICRAHTTRSTLISRAVTTYKLYWPLPPVSNSVQVNGQSKSEPRESHSHFIVDLANESVVQEPFHEGFEKYVVWLNISNFSDAQQGEYKFRVYQQPRNLRLFEQNISLKLTSNS